MSKNKGGRPLKFKTPEELENRIQEYYEYAEEHKEVLSVTGLAWYLDVDRLTLLRYENMFDGELYKDIDDDVKVKYCTSIKRAKAKVEHAYEQALFNKNSAVGAIFTLKNNYNWVDKQEIKQTNETIEVSLEE
jgi:hypothetical protein